jgi:putative SOS response-associated peptidase YedK
MIVILPDEAYAPWLNPRTNLDTVRSLMEPLPERPYGRLASVCGRRQCPQRGPPL